MRFSEYLIERNEFKTLQQNKVALSAEEHDTVMKGDATWHNGPNEKKSSAVWKSVDNKGKITYITHTHRAFNTATTLKGIIGKYHSFIKGTA